jgi:hypothetical protein
MEKYLISKIYFMRKIFEKYFNLFKTFFYTMLFPISKNFSEERLNKIKTKSVHTVVIANKLKGVEEPLRNQEVKENSSRDPMDFETMAKLRKKAIAEEIACNLLLKQLPIELIIEITELSYEEILAIKI